MRASHLDDFYQFLRFPSVSTDDSCSEKVAECAHWLVEKLTAIGLSAKLHPTPGHPVVWAHTSEQKPDCRTVLTSGKDAPVVAAKPAAKPAVAPPTAPPAAKASEVK